MLDERSLSVSEAAYTQKLLGSCKHTDLVPSHTNTALCLEATVDISAKNMVFKLPFQHKLNYGVFWIWITPHESYGDRFSWGFFYAESVAIISVNWKEFFITMELQNCFVDKTEKLGGLIHQGFI